MASIQAIRANCRKVRDFVWYSCYQETLVGERELESHAMVKVIGTNQIDYRGL